MKDLHNHKDHVVLADDDPDHGFLFQRVLKQVAPERFLTRVRDGAALIELLAREVPGLVFLDLNMPCKNGYECLEEIRYRPELSDLPVVVYSSSTQMNDIQRSYIYKADLYLVKPFNSYHLKNALTSILTMDWRRNYPNERFYFINNRFVPFTA